MVEDASRSRLSLLAIFTLLSQEHEDRKQHKSQCDKQCGMFFSGDRPVAPSHAIAKKVAWVMGGRIPRAQWAYQGTQFGLLRWKSAQN